MRIGVGLREFTRILFWEFFMGDCCDFFDIGRSFG